MHEAARLLMLDAIGITPLVPRFVLPGAKASPQGEIAVVATREQQTPQQVASQLASTAKMAPASVAAGATAAPAKAARSDRIDFEIAPATLRAEPVVTSIAAADSSEPTRLQVSLLQHHPRLFSLMPLYRADFQQEADQFLAAVAQAAGARAQVAAPQIFRWPFVNNAKLDHGINALREALAGFLRQSAREPGCVLLLWGVELSRYLPVTAVTAPAEFELAGNLRVIAVRRVQDYFNEPTLKRELWQQIRGLKPVLNEH